MPAMSLASATCIRLSPAVAVTMHSSPSACRNMICIPLPLCCPCRGLRTDIFPLSTLMERLIYHGTGSEEHTSELQSLMRISYAVFCLKKNKYHKKYKKENKH